MKTTLLTTLGLLATLTGAVRTQDDVYDQINEFKRELPNCNIEVPPSSAASIFFRTAVEEELMIRRDEHSLGARAQEAVRYAFDTIEAGEDPSLIKFNKHLENLPKISPELKKEIEQRKSLTKPQPGLKWEIEKNVQRQLVSEFGGKVEIPMHQNHIKSYMSFMNQIILIEDLFPERSGQISEISQIAISGLAEAIRSDQPMPSFEDFKKAAPGESRLAALVKKEDPILMERLLKKINPDQPSTTIAKNDKTSAPAKIPRSNMGGRTDL
jgi:hypothetical protein